MSGRFNIARPGLFSIQVPADSLRLAFNYKNEVIVNNAVPVDFVFIGDSITQFWELDAYFGRKGRLILNRGIGGDTTEYLLKRFEADVLQLKPKCCVLKIGVNDTMKMESDPWQKIKGKEPGEVKKTILGNMNSIVKLATENDLQLVVCSIYGYEYIYNGKSKHITRPPIDDIEDADKYRMPDIRMVSGDIVRQFKDTTDLFVFGQIGGPVSMLDEMFPMEDYMVYCLTNTYEMKHISEIVMEYEVQKAKLFIDNGADGIYIADDIAFNSGVFLPPQKMEELVYPFYKAAIKEIKNYRNVTVFFHSDGDLRKVMGKIVDSGFDGLQSLQPSAGMDIGEIKKDYGDALCLMGNIDLDYVMTFAPPEVVENTVKKTIDIAAPGGGYILSTCNTLITAIPDANVLAMYRTAHEYGVYKKERGIL